MKGWVLNKKVLMEVESDWQMPIYPLLIASPYVFHDEFHHYINHNFSSSGIKWNHECIMADYEYFPECSTDHKTFHRCVMETYNLEDEQRACDILHQARLDLVRNDGPVDVICGDEVMEMHWSDLNADVVKYENVTHSRRLILARESVRRLIVSDPEGCFNDGGVIRENLDKLV